MLRSSFLGSVPLSSEIARLGNVLPALHLFFCLKANIKSNFQVVAGAKIFFEGVFLVARNQRVYSVATLGMRSTKRGVHATYGNMERRADVWVVRVIDRSKGDLVVNFSLATKNYGTFPTTYHHEIRIDRVQGVHTSYSSMESNSIIRWIVGRRRR